MNNKTIGIPGDRSNIIAQAARNVMLRKSRLKDCKVRVDGKDVNAIRYMKRLATDLPLMEDKDTGEKIDHYENLRKAFIGYGVEGINNYLRLCNEVIQATIKERKATEDGPA